MASRYRVSIEHEPTVALLNDLVRLEFDAVHAHQSALSRLQDEAVRTQLAASLADHARHVETLQRLVSELRATPAGGADARRLLAQGKVVVRSLRGDDGILRAMRSNEDETNEAYERALLRGQLSPEQRRVLEENLADERRHRSWITSRLEERDALGV